MIDFDSFRGLGWLAGLAIAGILMLYLLLARKIVFGLFDPWFPMFFNQLIFLVLLSVLYFNHTLSSSHYYYWLASTTALVLPFGLLKKQQFPLFTTPSVISRRYAKFANLVIIVLSAYQLVFDLAFIANRGIPLLFEYGSNPQIYMGGYGVVKYIHDASKYLLPPIAVFSFFATGRRGVFFLALFATLYPTLLFEWSKVGLIMVLMYFWVASLVFFGPTRQLRRMTIAGLTLGSAYVLFMFSRVAATGYGDNSIDSLAIRLVQTIDSTYLYFIMGAEASIPREFTFAGYILSLISPFFGADASGNNIGHILLLASGLPVDEGYGPSPPFQVVGHIFLKDFGFLYALLVGIMLARMKNRFGSLTQEKAVLLLIVYNVAPVLAGDASLFLYYLFILIFLLPPIALAATMYFVLRGKNHARWGAA